MNKLARFLLVCAAVGSFLSVALGAFGAHVLRDRLGMDAMAAYQTAVQYQFWHALGLAFIGLLLRDSSSRALQWAGLLMVAGMLLFCGGLYLRIFSGVPAWAIGAPVGGLCWLLAWGLAGWAMLRAPLR